MKKIPSDPEDSDLATEYDFRAGTRGKYAQQYASGSNIIQLAPDVAEVFHDADAVNGLRLLGRPLNSGWDSPDTRWRPLNMPSCTSALVLRPIESMT